MADYTRPGEDGVPPTISGPRYAISTAGAPVTLECGMDRTLSATVTNTVPDCATADYLSLYQAASALLDRDIGRITCTPGTQNCTKHTLELIRTWRCGPAGSSPSSQPVASVQVTKRVFCASNAPVGVGLQPADAATFGRPGVNHEGSFTGNAQDTVTVDVSPGTSIGTSCGTERAMILSYSEHVASCEFVRDFEPYVTRAFTRVGDLLSVLSCPPQCDKVYVTDWHEWKCSGEKIVRVNVAFKLRCEPRPAAKPVSDQKGCMSAFAMLPVYVIDALVS